jgi:DNA-binding transcriptional regulator YiaG
MDRSDMMTIDELVARVREGRLPPPEQRRDIRASAGVSLREMAAALGVTPMTVLRWERGEVRPATGNAVAYRRLLHALRGAAR